MAGGQPGDEEHRTETREKRAFFKAFPLCTYYFLKIQLNCCGWSGPKDFAYTNDPIDESCYETVVRSNSGIWPRGRDADDFGASSSLLSGPSIGDSDAGPTVPTKKMKEDGCGAALVSWFRANKLVWAAVLASLVALQLMATGIAVYILSRVKKLRKLRKSRTLSRRHLYDSSSEGSHEFRPRI